MNLLDENFPEDQRALFRQWGIHVRQVGRDLAEYGADDDALIPLLHHLKGTTFSTHDQDFFERKLVHLAYCLVWLKVDEDEMGAYARRFLRHKAFATQAQRMGIVARVSVEGVQFWQYGRPHRMVLPWAQ